MFQEVKKQTPFIHVIVQVYRAVELVAHGVAQGFNGTIFAYGQTGSGKTYTMGGASDTSPRPWSSSFSLANPPDYTSGIGSTTPADHVDANTCGEMGGGTSDASGGGLGSEAGVIPRAVSTVLADANARKEQGWEFVLTATYVEIYNERIRDLLDPTNDNLKVSIAGVLYRVSQYRSTALLGERIPGKSPNCTM